MPRKGWLTSIAGGTLLLTVMSVTAAGGPAAAGFRSSHSGAFTTPALPLSVNLAKAGATAPTDAFCRANFGTPCYSPQEIRHAYGVDHLLSKGDDGKGETIVIIDSFGSPTIASDLASFDAGFGLPDPPSFKVLAPLGTVPFNPSANPDQISWAAETTLDVEWAHAMAPAASIVLLTSPVDETEGTAGLPEFDRLLNYALNHHLGQIISQSWGATENTLFDSAGQKVIRQFEATYARADAMGVTVFASAGDSGTANVGTDLSTIFPFPTVNFPASSPLITSVGGTSLVADTSGNYQSEMVWNSGDSATGGGISEQFAEPLYQRLLPRTDQKLISGKRGIPDISWNADPNTSILIFLSFFGPNATGYFRVGGTSEGAPQLAGLTADLDQAIGHPIGFLNPFIYALGTLGIGFHDVTTGNNGIDGVAGFDATPGWDASTGFGTPNLGQFFGDIAFLARGTVRGTPSLVKLRSRAASLRR
ncbi:MAG TPA: S53 family peptidase [Streptosporangiaceae bacterium]|nr:S53 family peptidase [Streptosporangiaceae bacterium]